MRKSTMLTKLTFLTVGLFSERVFSFWVKSVCLILLSVVGYNSVSGQTVVSNYLQSKTTSTYVAIGATTTLFTSSYAGNSATYAPVSATIPFTFNFKGTGYTTCWVNPNGYITFGAASTYNNYTPLSTFDAGVTGVVSAMAANYLKANAGGAIISGTTGTTPNRVFTIQWNLANINAITGYSTNFQINLFESTNKIQIVYGTVTSAGTAGTATAQVGVASSTGDFLNWKCTNSTTVITAGTNSGINWALLQPGSNSNASTCALSFSSTAYKPATGLTVEWTPRVNLLSPTNVNNTGFTMNWTAPANSPASDTVYLSTVSTFASNVSGFPVVTSGSATSLVVTGLTTGTTYYYKVVPKYSSIGAGLTSSSVTNSIVMPVVVPVTLTPASYNYDGICNGGNTIGGTLAITGSMNISMGATVSIGIDQQGYTAIASDFYNVPVAQQGICLQPGGSIVENVANGIVYQLAPYNQNNLVYFATGSGATRNINFATPVAATSVHILAINPSSPNANPTYTVKFTDSSVQTPSTTCFAPNWCTSNNPISVAMMRANINGSDNTGTTGCQFLTKDTIIIQPANYSKSIAYITCSVNAANVFYTIFGASVQKVGTLIPTSSSLTGFSVANCAIPSTSQTVTLTGANLANPTPNTTGTGNILITAPLAYKVSTDNITFTKTVNMPFVNCGINALPLYVKLDTNVIGPWSGTITFSGGSIPAANLPTITVSGTVNGVKFKAAGASTYPLTFGTTYFGPVTQFVQSAAVVDSLTATGLSGSITLTSSNSDFQLSADNITYGTTITLTPSSGSITPSVPIYMKVTASAVGPNVSTITIGGGIPSCSYSFKDSATGGAGCTTPGLPTSMIYSGTNATLTNVGFTASGTPDGYLLVQSSVPFVAGSDPVTGTNYSVSGAFGNGTVVGIYNSAPPLAVTGLTANTSYYYTVVPFNGGTSGGTCGGGPLYPSGTQLTGSVTTCVAAPTSIATSGVTASSFVLSWTASAGGTASAVTYLVDISTNNSFTAPISGSPFVLSGTSLSITGLTTGANYYYRLTAQGACNSAATIDSINVNPTTIKAEYFQSKSTSTYTTVGSPTTLFTAGYNGSSASPASVSIPFSFNFKGAAFTSCWVNPNGYITFGAASAGTNYSPISTFNSGVKGVVSAFACNYLTGTGTIVYGTTGSSPNRVFTIQWNSAKVNAYTGNAVNFQINLFESTNKIQIVYGATTLGTAGAATTTQVGIASSSSDFLDWKATAGTTAALGGNTGTSWPALAPGELSTSTVGIVNSAAGNMPATGLTLEWTPRVNLLSPTNVTNTTAQINWSSISLPPTTITVEVSTSSTIASNIAGYPVTISGTATSLVVSGLTTGTQYYYRVTPSYSSIGAGLVSASIISSIIMPVAVPVVLTPETYNYDGISNGGNSIGGTIAIPGSSNIMLGTGGIDQQGYTIVASDFYNLTTALANTALPAGGSVKENTTNGVVYQLSPYNANNIIYFPTGSAASRNLNFATPVAATTVHVLALSPSVASPVTNPTYTIKFTDSSTQSGGSCYAPNWCSATNPVSAVMTRSNINGSDNSSTCWYLTKDTLTILPANCNKQIAYITCAVNASSVFYTILGVSVQKTGILTPSATTLSGFIAASCAPPSASQTVTLTGSNLANPTPNATGTGNILATAPLGYKISADNISFAKTVNLAFTNCGMAAIPLYVRLDTTASGSFTGNITFSGGSIPAANLPTIALIGATSGVQFKPAGATSYPGVMPTMYFGPVTQYVTSSAIVDSITGVGLTSNVVLSSGNADFQLSTDNITYGSTITVTISGGGITPARPIYHKVTASALGVNTSIITISSGTVCTITQTTKDSATGSTPCIYPSAPVGLGFSGTTATTTIAGFTPVSSADGYLVVRSYSAFAGGSDPIATQTYLVNDTLGNGKVIGVFPSAPPLSTTGLNGNTNYYLTVIPYNGSAAGGTCGGGPLYSLGTQLSDVVTTCPAAPTFGSVTATVNTATFNWASAAGGNALPVTYTLEVTTDAGFTSHVIGSPFTISGPATSLTVTALNGGITYYYRIKATTSACASGYTNGSVTTTSYCAPGFTNGCGGSGYYTSSLSINGYTWTGTLANCGISNYTSTVFSVTAGVVATYTATTQGFTGNGLWIDFNNDGDFLDAGEQLMGYYIATAPAFASTSFTVGPTVTTGTYRMRIITGWGTDCISGGGNGSGPCGAGAPGGVQYAYGSYQDFTVYVNNPILTPSITSIPAYGIVPTCSTSATTNFTITGTGLSPAAGNIVGHAPAGMQISTNSTTWDTTISYAYTGGILPTSNVYARYAPTSPGAISGNITFSGGSVFVTPTVTLSGGAGGIDMTPTTASAFGPFGVGFTSYARLYTLTGSNLPAGNITVSTNNPDFAVSADSITYSTTGYSFANGTTLTATPVYIHFTPSALGLDTGTITITSPTGCVKTISVNGYGAVGCTAPSLPTALSFFGVNGTSANITFTPTGGADGYIVARSTVPFVPGSDPVTAHDYIVGDALGNATVVGINTIVPPYSATTLSSNTNYYYTIIPFNGGATGGTCLGGPLYPSGTQLTGLVTTCPSAPTTLTSSNIAATSATLSWSSSAGGGASTLSYSVEVATDTSFASPIAGSPFTVSGATTTITGLGILSTYYYRVSAMGACTSSPSTRGTFSTSDNYIPMTISSGFNADIIANGSTAPSTTTSFPTGSASFDNAGYDLIGLPYSFYTSGTVTYSLPATGLLSSSVVSNLKFQLSNYTGNNSLYLHSGIAGIPTSGTMAFASPAGASVVYVMGISGTSSTAVTYTLNYTDGSSESYPTVYTYPDWFQNTGVNTSLCYNSIGRISSAATSTTNSGGDATYPAFSQAAITVSATGQTKTIQSVTANYSSGTGYLGITAVSVKAGMLTSSVSSLSAFASTDTGCSTTAQTFTITGSALLPSAGNITASAPTGFQVSNDGTTWGSTAIFAYTGGAMSAATVYVRFRPTAIGAASGNVTFSGGASGVPPVVAVSGTGTTFSVSASAASGVYCSTGSPVGLSATGTAATYSWSPSISLDVATGTSVNATPTVTTIYTVTGTNAAACASKTSTVTVTYNVATGPITGSSITLCLPGVLALTEAGTGGTWSSSNNAIATVDVNGVVYGVASSLVSDTITYNNIGCGGSATYELYVNNGGFSVTLPSSGTYCNSGSALAINASAPGATNFTWTPSSGLDVTTGTDVNASPSATTVYTVIASDGSCSNSASITVWNITPGIISGGTTTLCTTGAGSTTTWSDTTAGGTWSVLSGSVATITSGGVITPTTPLTAGVVSIAYTHSGCSVTRDLTVNASPTLSTLPVSASVCGSTGVTLTVSGASTYSWTPGASLSAATGSSVFATPGTNTTYSITGTSIAGCISSTTKSVNVSPAISAVVTASSYTVCPGNTTTLTSQISGDYSVATIPYGFQAISSPVSGPTGDEATTNVAIPFSFNFYGVNYSSVNICTNGYINFGTSTTTGYTNTVGVSMPSTTYPQGAIGLFLHDMTNGTTGGTITYGTNGTTPNRKFIVYYNNYGEFSGSGTSTGEIILYESTNIVECHIANNTLTATHPYVVGVQNIARNLGTVAPLRNGVLTNISAAEGWRFSPPLSTATYSWTPSAGLSTSTSAATVATVSSPATYSVTITDPSSGCNATFSAAIGTYSVPVVAVPTPVIGCAGFAMTATGASTYTWSPSTSLSATTGATVTPNPTVTVTYTATGTSTNGCIATATKLVNPSPSFTVTPASGTVCLGGSVTFSSTGTSTYSWSPSASLSASTGSSVVASPTISTLYTVTGTDGIGCSSTRTAIMGVNTRPTVASITPSSTTLCTGTTLTLTPVSVTGTGVLTSYNWSGPDGYVYTTTAATAVLVPASTAAGGVYSLSVTYPGFGCTSTTAITSPSVTVNDVPSISGISASSPACVGSTLTLTASGVTGTGSPSYAWSGPTGFTATTSPTAVRTPTATTAGGVYSLIVTYPGTGCTTPLAQTSSVTVNPAMVAGSITGSTTLLVGNVITLTGVGASGGTVAWSSTNTSVATVSSATSTGVVYGVGDGTATISYTTTNPCGSSVAATVNVTIQTPPVINSISSNVATPGTTITISGDKFNSTAANNVVMFGATQGTITGGSTTSLTVTVPIGATMAPITVLNTANGLSGYSNNPFIPNYDTTLFILPDDANSVNFLPKVDFTVGLAPNIAAIGDLNGDGKPEVVSVNAAGTSISIYKNVASTGIISGSSFTLYATYTTGANPQNVKIADMDGDNKPEIIVTSKNTSQINIYRNQSSGTTLNINGTRLNYSTISSAAQGAGPIVLTINDIDGDGKPDITSFCYDGNGSFLSYLSVLRNTTTSIGGLAASGSFATAVTAFAGFSSQSGSITTADLDGNHKPDIILSNQATATISVFPNTSYSGVISLGSAISLSTGSASAAPTEVQSGDIDGDGFPDLAVSNAGAGINTVGVFRNTNTTSAAGSFTFASRVDIATGAGTQPVGLALADVTGDGLNDLIVGNYNANTVSVFRNRSTIGSIVMASAVSYGTGTTLVGVVVGDLDGDTYPDIIGANAASSSISVIKNYPLPHVEPITGITPICSGGGTVTISNATPSGAWSMTNANATITSGGLVTGAAPGLDTAVYTVTVRGQVNTTRSTITINTTPSVILGANPSVCQPTTSTSISYTGAVGSPTLYDIVWNTTSLTAGFTNVTGGTLSSPVSLVIPLDTFGVFGGDITVSNANCTSTPATFIATVYAHPTAAITSATSPCVGSSTNVVFTGTQGAVVAYQVDSATILNGTLTGGTFTLPTGALTAVHNYTLRNAHNPACTTAIDTVVFVNPIPQAWTGGASGAESDWHTAANWACGTIPVVTDDVLIPSGTTYSPVIGTSATANTRSLTLASGVVVSIGSASTLNVKGNLTNAGTVTGSGSLSMNGSTAQTISGTGQVNYLEIANTSGGVAVNAGSRVAINKTLTMTSGTLATSDSVVLVSNDTVSSARITPIAPGALITGKVQVQQYIQGGYRRFRFLSHPFSTAISLSQLQPYIDITGTGGSANGFTTTGSNAPSAFRYDPYTANSSLTYDAGWKPYTDIRTSVTSDTNTFNQYQGIRIFLRGSKGEGLGYWFGYTPSSAVISMAGVVNQGDQTITLYKGSGTVAGTPVQEYNMVGNPYPSPVDFGTAAHNALVSGDIVGAAFYVWNPSIGASGQFQAIPINTVSAAPYYVQANTAVQVRADHDIAHLTFHESNKNANATTYLFKALPESVSLFIYDANYHPWDMLYVKFNDGASEGDDKYMDATKPSGSDFNFYSLSSDNRKMVIDARPYDANKIVPLGISSSYNQEFIIKAESVVLPAGGSIYLHDKMLQKYVELKAGTEYRFNITKDKSTQGDNRFELSMKPATVADAKGLQVTMTPNPATDDVKIKFTSAKAEHVTVRVLDMSGVNVYSDDLGVQQKGIVNVPLSKLASGIYMVELTSGDQKVTQRLVKE